MQSWCDAAGMFEGDSVEFQCALRHRQRLGIGLVENMVFLVENRENPFTGLDALLQNSLHIGH